MKKNSPKSKQKTSSKQKYSTPKARENRSANKPIKSQQKKGIDKKKDPNHSPVFYLSKVGQFLRESKMELKKVKWPTRKELLASTAVVIVLTLFVAFYLGLVDFGLIKIIKAIVG